MRLILPLLLFPFLTVCCTNKNPSPPNSASSVSGTSQPPRSATQAPSDSADQSILGDTFVNPEGDVKAGELISKQGTPKGAAACIACHGANGEGQSAAGFPRLANQPRMYLAQQLKNYQNGSRNNAVMTPIAKALSDTEIENVSGYFEKIKPPPFPKAAALKGENQKRGHQLAEVGDQKLAVQSCANCHGPGGMGEPPVIPYLAGQNATYIEVQLQNWKNGTRKTNVDHMGYIANSLSDKDIKIMATYFQQIRR